MEKFKIGDKLIADDIGYWGPKFNYSTVKVVAEKHPLYSVECFDGLIRDVHHRTIVDSFEFYSQASGRAGESLLELADEDGNNSVDSKSCNCDMTSLMRYGCKCGGV